MIDPHKQYLVVGLPARFAEQFERAVTLAKTTLETRTREAHQAFARRLEDYAAAALGIPVTETLVPREMLYIADEVFFSGTAAEITPIRSVDHIVVGKGSRGPVTEKLQKAFFGIVHGDAQDRFGWLTPVTKGGAITKNEPVTV